MFDYLLITKLFAKWYYHLRSVVYWYTVVPL